MTSENYLENVCFTFSLKVKSFTWLVMEKTTNTSFRSVEEGCRHGVILPVCTEQLGEAENEKNTFPSLLFVS